jgi:hypothetical protein
MIKQTKRLVAHENLIYDVICRQAGTLSKAVLEGVMNSIDAGADRIDLTLKSDHVVIADNGVGFLSEKEIDEWFAMFGTPHEVDGDDNSTDARYGRFRMGRGQLFAFGVNRWVTNNFEMEVDVKTNGLNFELQQHPTVLHAGCSVTVELYKLLDAAHLVATTREILKFCKYVDVDLFLNGDKINTDPRTQKWDHETDDGWVKVTSTSDARGSGYYGGTGVDVYQQGVYVETIATYSIGVSGTVVTKAPLKLNFARNQVMQSTCPRWKRIHVLLKGISQDVNSTKVNLSPNERIAMISQLLTGDMKYKDARTMRLFQDVQEKAWSINQIVVAASQKSKFKLNPDHTLALSFAPARNNKADRLMQDMRALILDQSLLEVWEVSAENFVEKVLSRFKPGITGKIVYKKLNDLDATLDDTYQLLEASELTARETLILKVLEHCKYEFTWLFAYSRDPDINFRTFRIGKSSHAAGWTDGSTYIAIDIEEIRAVVKSPVWSTWYALARVMLHEYCHDAPNLAAHTHDAHFYQMYHDMSRHLGAITNKLHSCYLKLLQNQGKKIPQRIQLQALREAEIIQRSLAVDINEQDKLNKNQTPKLITTL